MVERSLLLLLLCPFLIMGSAASANLGVMDGQVLKAEERADPNKCLVACKNGSPTAGYQIGYKIGEYV